MRGMENQAVLALQRSCPPLLQSLQHSLGGQAVVTMTHTSQILTHAGPRRGRRAIVLGTGMSTPYLLWLSIPPLESVPLLSSGRDSPNSDPPGCRGMGRGGLQGQVQLGLVRIPPQVAA